MLVDRKLGKIYLKLNCEIVPAMRTRKNIPQVKKEMPEKSK